MMRVTGCVVAGGASALRTMASTSRGAQGVLIALPTWRVTSSIAVLNRTLRTGTFRLRRIIQRHDIVEGEAGEDGEEDYEDEFFQKVFTALVPLGLPDDEGGCSPSVAKAMSERQG